MKYLYVFIIILNSFCLHASAAMNSKLYKTHDLVTGFVEGWEKIKSEPQTKWEKYWWNYFLNNEDLFLYITNCNNEKFRDLAIKYFQSELNQRYAKMPQIIFGAKKNLPVLKSYLAGALTLLNKTIPIKNPVDVYYVMNIHPFDGKEFFYGNVPAFAMDLSFSYGQNFDYTAIFIHECVHVLHFRNVGKSLEDDPIGCIMREGLAVYATKVILSGSPDSRFTIPEKDIEKCKQNYREIIKEMLKCTNNYEKMNKQFYEQGQKLKWPSRCGYYIGLKMMENLAHKYTLEELINMPTVKYRREVISILKEMLKQNKLNLYQLSGNKALIN